MSTCPFFFLFCPNLTCHLILTLRHHWSSCYLGNISLVSVGRHTPRFQAVLEYALQSSKFQWNWIPFLMELSQNCIHWSLSDPVLPVAPIFQEPKRANSRYRENLCVWNDLIWPDKTYKDLKRHEKTLEM